MGELLALHAPHVAVSLSSYVSPTMGEYNRSCTPGGNASVQPVVRRYIARLACGIIKALRTGFAVCDQALCGRTEGDATIEAVTRRVIASGIAPDVQMAAPMSGIGLPQTGARLIWSGHARAMVMAPVYDRYRRAHGHVCHGPAVVAERESTALLPHGAIGQVDAGGNLIITLNKALAPTS